jgi:hypothetical protein
MTSRVHLLVFGAFLLAIAVRAPANAAGGKTPAVGEQPLSVSLLQLIATSIVLAEALPPPRVSWWRHLVAAIICLLILAGPFGLYAIASWSFK